MVTVISRFRVRNGLEDKVRSAFLNRPRLVEKVAGFRGFEVLTDAADPSVFLLLTWWRDQESFRAWHRSAAHHESHELIPQGLKLDASFTSLTVGNRIEDPAGAANFNDALAGQTVGISRWLMESNAIFALLVTPDGTITLRNRAAARIFPPDPANNFGLNICDYLVCSDATHLRQRLLNPEAQDDSGMRLNMADENQKCITFEVGMVSCGGTVLLVGTQEHQNESHFQTEILQLTNDLSMMMREAARNNRELKEANKVIERLAHTDALTGLANRRTLDEAFAREIARSQRQGQPLTVVIADLDHFKSVNDQHGHRAGDQVLARTAAVFGSQLRAYDLAARYGGEEFVLLLPGTSHTEAIEIAERIRKDVAELDFPEIHRQITVSLGIASWISGEAPEDVFARADAALYKAKECGRNRVETAPTGMQVFAQNEVLHIC